MDLDRPIFIVGTGRCGSTIFHRMFVHHPEVAFLSGLCLLYPNKPRYNRLGMRLMDVPVLRHMARKKFRPAEHWPFWDNYIRGFSFPCRDLTADDVRPYEAERIRGVLGQMLTPRRRRRLVKISGWPRIGFLQEVFPDALFIHLIRDGRAVVNSLLNVNFWQGWGGPARLGIGELNAEELDEWENSDRSFVVLAAIRWKRFMDAFELAKRRVPASQYFEVGYAELINDPTGTFETVLDFCGLIRSGSFLDYVRQFPLRNENDKWKHQLTPHQQKLLNESLKEYLVRYGMEAPPVRPARQVCA